MDTNLENIEPNEPVVENTPSKEPLSRADVELRLQELDLAFTGKQQAFIKAFAELGTVTKAIRKINASTESFMDWKRVLERKEAKEYLDLLKLQADWEKELTRDEVILNAREIVKDAIANRDYKAALEANKFLGAQLAMAGTGLPNNTSKDQPRNLSLTLVQGNSPSEVKEDLTFFNDIISKLSLPNKIKDITPKKQ